MQSARRWRRPVKSRLIGGTGSQRARAGRRREDLPAESWRGYLPQHAAIGTLPSVQAKGEWPLKINAARQTAEPMVENQQWSKAPRPAWSGCPQGGVLASGIFSGAHVRAQHGKDR